MYLSLSPSILSCNDSPSLWKNRFYRSNKSWLFRHNNRMRERYSRRKGHEHENDSRDSVWSYSTQTNFSNSFREEKSEKGSHWWWHWHYLSLSHIVLLLLFTLTFNCWSQQTDSQVYRDEGNDYDYLCFFKLLNYCRREVVSCSLSNQHLLFWETSQDFTCSDSSYSWSFLATTTSGSTTTTTGI